MESYRKIIKLVNKMGDDRESNKKIISKSGIETYALDIEIILKKSNNIKKVLEFINVCYELDITTRWNREMYYFLSELYGKLFSEFEEGKLLDKEIINKLYEFTDYEYLAENDMVLLEIINTLIRDEETREYAKKSLNTQKKGAYLNDFNLLEDYLYNEEKNKIKEYIIEVFGDVNYTDRNGSLLHYAFDTVPLRDGKLFSICSKLLEIGVDPNLIDVDNYTFLDSVIARSHNYELYKLSVDNGCQITDSFYFEEVDRWCCEDAKKISISAHFRLMISDIKLILNEYSLEEDFDKKLFYIDEELFTIFEELLNSHGEWDNIEKLIIDNILKNKESEIGLNKIISANEVVEAIIDVYKNNLDKKKLKYQTKMLEYKK